MYALLLAVQLKNKMAKRKESSRENIQDSLSRNKANQSKRQKPTNGF